MSSSGYAKVIYGYCFDIDFLRVQDGTKMVCSRNSTHEIVPGKGYCPSCGGFIDEAANMMPSDKVHAYAKEQSISVEDALDELNSFQTHCYIKYDKEAWVFGKVVAEAGNYDGVVDFEPCKDYKLSIIFSEFGLNPAEAKHYLVVEIH